MKLAVIGTFFERYEESQKAIKRVMESTRVPDEFWIMCETLDDVANAKQAFDGEVPASVKIVRVPTPKTDGKYDIIPYSNKINKALDLSKADAFVYLDNGSMPHPWKYDLMLTVLDGKPTIGAVYCTQHRTGHQDVRCPAELIVPDAFCVLNYTQVMHRKTDARWPLDMTLATPNDLADAYFWRELHSRIGAFYPVNSRHIMLDQHHIPSPAMNGL